MWGLFLASWLVLLISFFSPLRFFFLVFSFFFSHHFFPWFGRGGLGDRLASVLRSWDHGTMKSWIEVWEFILPRLKDIVMLA
jgi:hypothetical protein